jgi:hypothetical protein
VVILDRCGCVDIFRWSDYWGVLVLIPHRFVSRFFGCEFSLGIRLCHRGRTLYTHKHLVDVLWGCTISNEGEREGEGMRVYNDDDDDDDDDDDVRNLSNQKANREREERVLYRTSHSFFLNK